jgi:hypothetical protein
MTSPMPMMGWLRRPRIASAGPERPRWDMIGLASRAMTREHPVTRNREPPSPGPCVSTDWNSPPSRHSGLRRSMRIDAYGCGPAPAFDRLPPCGGAEDILGREPTKPGSTAQLSKGQISAAVNAPRNRQVVGSAHRQLSDRAAQRQWAQPTVDGLTSGSSDVSRIASSDFMSRSR